MCVDPGAVICKSGRAPSCALSCWSSWASSAAAALEMAGTAAAPGTAPLLLLLLLLCCGGGTTANVTVLGGPVPSGPLRTGVPLTFSTFRGITTECVKMERRDKSVKKKKKNKKA